MRFRSNGARTPVQRPAIAHQLVLSYHAAMRPRAPFRFALAALLYTVVFGTVTYPLALEPTTHSALQAGGPNDFFKLTDQMLSISWGARNAAAILAGDPARLIDNGFCYPTPMAATLGEHLIEPGLLGLPAYAISGNPVLAYNFAALLSFVIAGLAMLALVRHWTGSWVAGFVAGLLFAFHPFRLEEIGHLHVIGIHWLPLVLLFFDRLLVSARALDAGLLALFASLQVLVGSYPLMILAGFGVPFGVVRLIQLRAELDLRRLGLLGLAVLVVLGVAAAALVPYTIAGDAWQTLNARVSILSRFAWLLPGGIDSPGLLALALAFVLLLLWPRTRHSAAFAVLLGTLTCFLLAAKGVLWPGGPFFTGVYPWLADQIWVLGTVRVPSTIRLGGYFGIALLAGLGLGFLLERLQTKRLVAGAVGVAALLAAFVELFHPILSPAVYHHDPTLVVGPRTPSESTLAAYAVFDEQNLPGPILELPYPNHQNLVFTMPTYILRAAYHQRPTAACFNSHTPPSYDNVLRIASRLPTERAIHELAAVGLRNLVFEGGTIAFQIRAIGEALGRQPGAEVIHRGGMVSVRIHADVETHSDPAQLEPLAIYPRQDFWKGGKRHLLDLEIRNRDSAVWALPQPIRAHAATLRWWKGDEPGDWVDERVMLPLALDGGQSDRVAIVINPPPPDCENCTAEIRIDELGWQIRSSEAKPDEAEPATSEGS